MKISVDGGGLCSDRQLGTYTFNSSLISALQEYDKENKYTVYTFCNTRDVQNSKFRFKNLQPTTGWMKLRVAIEETISQKDIFLGLNQAIPFYTPAKTIIFSQGLSFRYFPEFYPNDYLRLKKQLINYLNRACFIVVSSKRVYREFVELYPRALDRIVVMPFGIPYDMNEYKKEQRRPFFLFCAMNHKVKNVELLVKTFNKLMSEQKFKQFSLYLVGSFKEFENKNIKVFDNITRPELRTLYRQATAYIAPSYYESFNFPVLEALSQNCPVIGLKSALIPEMEKYCTVVSSDKAILDRMQAAAIGKLTPTDLRELRHDFSWQTYINKLKDLYQKA